MDESIVSLKRLRLARITSKGKPVSQTKLAQAADLDHSTVVGIEKGHKKARPDTLAKLVEGLNSFALAPTKEGDVVERELVTEADLADIAMTITHDRARHAIATRWGKRADASTRGSDEGQGVITFAAPPPSEQPTRKDMEQQDE